MEENQKYVELLIDTLQKQIETLKEILEITKEQSSIADREDFREGLLEDSLNKKEILITKLNEMDEGFHAVYERVRGEIIKNQTRYENEIKKMQTMIKECTDLGVEIETLEHRNKDKLAKCFSKKNKEYNIAKTSTQVADHYHKTMSDTKILDAYFLDKRK